MTNFDLTSYLVGYGNKLKQEVKDAPVSMTVEKPKQQTIDFTTANNLKTLEKDAEATTDPLLKNVALIGLNALKSNAPKAVNSVMGDERQKKYNETVNALKLIIYSPSKAAESISKLTEEESLAGEERAIISQQNIENKIKLMDKGINKDLNSKIDLWKDILTLYGQKKQETIQPVAELGQGVSQKLQERGNPILSRIVGAATSAITAPTIQTAQGMEALGKGNIVEGITGLAFGKLSSVSPSAMGFNAVMGTPEAQKTIGKALEVWDEATKRTIYKIMPKEMADAVKLGLELYIFKKFDDALKIPFKTKQKVPVVTADGVKTFEVPVDRQWYANLKQNLTDTANKFVADPTKFLNEMPVGLSIKDVSKEFQKKKSVEVTPPKVTPMPVEAKGVSKVGQSIEESAVKDKLTKAFEGTAEYTKITIEDQAKRTSELINTDIVKAKKILNGEESLPEGMRGASLITALEDYAVKNKDVQLLQDIAKSPLTSETSIHAQEMRILAERNPDSPVEAIRSVKQIREERAKRFIRSQKQDIFAEINSTIKDLDREFKTMIKEGKKTEADIVKREIKDLQKDIKAQAKMSAKEMKEKMVKTMKAEIAKTAPKKTDWDSFIDSITC